MKLIKVKKPFNAKRMTVLPTENLRDGSEVKAYYTEDFETDKVTQYEKVIRTDGKIEWYKLDTKGGG